MATDEPSFDPNVMSHARAYDYVLGGKDNFEVDRIAAQAVIDLAPDLPALGKAQRRFLLRIVQKAANEGIDQFLDIGSGLPTSPNVHETAHAINPAAKVVYVDADPLVYVHNNALLASHESVISLQEDVRQPQRILDNPHVRELIDFDKPVLILFIGLFHLVADGDDPAGIVARYRDRMASGSYMALSQFCTDGSDPAAKAKLEEISVGSPQPMCFRTRAEIRPFFDGFDLLDPGLVDVQDWWPEETEAATALKVAAGIGKKV
ncbi:SAM-dependent methyltransferase [Virgisporangium aurantiacum]|uniref:S-adenosyl methyltransferase n=1 Tax=Virgisporangium aurantiacum TaxID=175570 RepID=A0A8J3ZA10_9ACTN|nr:SAM-dependent methyltransferase [Virgisporangium aurantiacum]GIJ60136.1 hypothetical protein Vau01_076520 [Virgisporangium aurantiacum]